MAGGVDQKVYSMVDAARPHMDALMTTAALLTLGALVAEAQGQDGAEMLISSAAAILVDLIGEVRGCGYLKAAESVIDHGATIGVLTPDAMQA